MKYVPLNLEDNSYKIVVGSEIFSEFVETIRRLRIGQDAVIITNPIIHKLHGRKLISRLKKSGFSVKVFDVPDGEKSKSVDVAVRLLAKIATHDVKKKIFIIAFGGGVIGDLAGFVAAIYKRGIPYIQIPTTFLSQIDSSIGGKTGLDLAVGKNLVGAFYQPRLVFSDTALLSTLSQRQIKNGLAEAVKYGVICDKELFEYIARNYEQLFSCNSEVLMNVILSCSRIKAKIVMKDEKETRGIRTILNFGHTIGHAIEAAAKYNYYCHGEAIAIGMVVAADISYQLGLLKRKEALRIEKVLCDIGLPVRIEKVGLAEIIKTMGHDKKFQAGKNRFVLATKIGHVKIVEGVPLSVIKKAIKTYS